MSYFRKKQEEQLLREAEEHRKQKEQEAAEQVKAKFRASTLLLTVQVNKHDGLVTVRWGASNFGHLEPRLSLFRIPEVDVETYGDAKAKGELIAVTESEGGEYEDHVPAQEDGGDYYYVLFLLYKNSYYNHTSTRVYVQSTYQREMEDLERQTDLVDKHSGLELSKAKYLKTKTVNNEIFIGYAASEVRRREVEDITGQRLSKINSSLVIGEETSPKKIVSAPLRTPCPAEA